MKFREYLASQLYTLKWRHFGAGALQAYLFEGPYEQRVHIWHKSLEAVGIRGQGGRHDHRFSFVSQVIHGIIRNTAFRCISDAAGDFDIYSVVNARKQKEETGSYDGNVTFSHRARMPSVDGGTYYQAGQSYEFESGMFHETDFHGLTITLVTKFAFLPGGWAHIAVPHGKTLVHAFDESRKPDIWRVLGLAHEALSR